MSARNGRVLEGLRRSAAEGRLHHAYILAGPQTPTKIETARRIAADFSSSPAETFERILRGNHPDFLLIMPTEGLIGVDEIRTLPKSLAYPPLEIKRRVVVIEEAHLMNAQANNALLKILEEPPGHTMFFLLCRDAAGLLPTIVSRCQVIRFAPLSSEELLKALGGREIEDPSALLAWSEGALSRAEVLLGAEGGFSLRREACDRLLELWEASPRIPSATFQFVESIASGDPCQVVLDSWSILLRDFAFTASGAGPDGLRFPEYHSRLAALAQGKGAPISDEVAAKSAAINRFRVYQQFNGNLRLDFANLLTDLQVFSVGKARNPE